MAMLTGNPPLKRWLLTKEGRSSWYSYYEDVVADAVKDGWQATLEEGE